VRERLIADFGPELASVQTTGRTLTGYASVFNYPIDSGTPAHPQTTFVRPGAFKRTLANNRERVQVLFNHGQDPRYGELPIGTIKHLEEDRRGLRAEVELHDGPDNENIRAALASGALRAMSIQFETMQESYNDDRSERYLEELGLWEFGPVTFPANEAATASLHSLAQYLAQPEPPSDDARDSTVDEARLTWAVQAHRLLDVEDSLLERAAARIAALKEA
jgi:HK97 family phage prohead protease